MNRMRSLFFPTGKIHVKYTSYVGWSFVSNVLVSAESAMATHSMLHSIGGDVETIRTANYIGKDIIGQLGCLAYIAKTGKEADKDPLRFLLYSNNSQQFAYMSFCATLGFQIFLVIYLSLVLERLMQSAYKSWLLTEILENYMQKYLFLILLVAVLDFSLG